MEIEKQDRRVRRTNRLLKQALAELMREKDFQEISVRDVAERADINRGTFYMHFSSTYDLLAHLENETLKDFQSMIDQYAGSTQARDLRSLLEPITDYIAANADICKCLFQNRAASDFLDKFQQLIYENGTMRIRARFPNVAQDTLHSFFAFATFGMIGILKEWLDADLPEGREIIVSHAAQLVSGAAEGVLSPVS